jgi:hypothetical protein
LRCPPLPKSMALNSDQVAIDAVLNMAPNDQKIVRGLHQGQQSQPTASTGRTEDRTRPMPLRQFIREPSTEDTKADNWGG